MTAHQVSCSCGWAGTYATPGYAAYNLRRHSCDRQQILRDREARVAARKAAAGPRRDCHHPRAHHQHGTRVAYVTDRCRCRRCRDANTAAEQALRRAKAYGTWNPYVDADPIRAHIRALADAGVGLKQVARLSGVSNGSLTKLVYGLGDKPSSKRVLATTAERILAVTPDQLAGGTRTSPTGSRRRIQALIACGWSVNAIATRTGVDVQALARALVDAPISARNAQRIRDAYDQLWDTPPPQATHRQRISVSRSLRRAQAAGWPRPADWDDEDLDDPYAPTPDPSQHRERGGQPRVHIDDVEWLARAGETPRAIAARLGVTDDSIDKALRRHERHDLLQLLAWNREGAA